MSDASPAMPSPPYLVVADGPGWPALGGLAVVHPDHAATHVRAAAAGGKPVQVVLYRPVSGAPLAALGNAIRGLWAADPRVQVVLALPDTGESWDEVRRHLRPGDGLVPVPIDAVTGPAVEQIADALSSKWAAAANADATAAEVDRRVADRTADLNRLALHDRLTGLGNRALLNDRLTQVIDAAATDPDRVFAVLFLDFDRFKLVNDSLGHDVGDGLLIAIADRLRRTLRETDTVSTGSADNEAIPAARSTAARLGGDEFILLLDRLREPADAVRVAERVLVNLAAPYTVNGHTIHSTASIGITTNTVGYTSGWAMIRDADTAMYRAKGAGKARYVVFDPHMHAEAVDRLTLEGDLRAALDLGQLALHYQPILRLDPGTGRAGTVVGVEALLRWRHPGRGSVSPGAFIPIAEEIGCMVAIGDWVLETACAQLAHWRSNHAPAFVGMAIHLNLSRRQLLPGFADRLARTLAAHGLPPAVVHLEFTERAIADDPTTAVAVLHQLRGLGVELHLDNFGTGHSSLSCLHRYPLSGLKVGANFTRDALTRAADRTVLAAVVGLARDLNLQLVAEGIETDAQVELLRQLGCRHAQGFQFSRPLPPAAAEAFLLGRRP
jgi:diguanylate cyclase (GGDEF)-like protein